MKRIAFYAGSFDPFTRGHLAIVAEALNAFDEIVIGVGVNPDKKGLFEADERKNLIEASLKEWVDSFDYRGLGLFFSKGEERAIVKVKKGAARVVIYDNLTVDAALHYGATALVRGERIVGDHDAEMALAMVNRRLIEIRGQHLDLVSIQVPKPELTYVSSSAVKSLCAMGEYIVAMDFVTSSVHQVLMERYLKPRFDKLPINKDDAVWLDVCNAYSDGRRYHTLSHIGYCLNYADILCRSLDDERIVSEETALKVAIFYHDYCCNGMSSDEENSWNKAHSVINMWRTDIGSSVEKLIKETAHWRGRKPREEFYCQVMHDVDLAILADEKNYPHYAMLVRQEYQNVSDKEYACNRIEVLQNLMSRPLFTKGFFDEEVARNNMAKEIAFWQSVR